MPKIIEDEQVYQAVLDTVMRYGYTGATTKEMASAAGVSEMTLFRKYGSKPQLVKQALLSILAQTDFEEAAAYTGDISEDLARVVRAYQDSAVRHGPFFVILLSEIPRHPNLSEAIDAPFSVLRSIVQLLGRYQTEGILRSDLHAWHMMAALLGPVIYMGMLQNARQGVQLPDLDLVLHVDGFIRGHLL